MTEKEKFKECLDNVIVSFNHGSYVYGTRYQPKSDCEDIHSDFDIVGVVKDNVDLNDYTNGIFEYKDPQCNGCFIYDYQFINKSKYIEMIKNHHIIALESFSLDDFYIVNDKPHVIRFLKDRYFIFDKWKLRQTISSICNNAWAKCHKKLTVEKDYNPYVAKKSLFHSLRLWDFGKQMAENDGKIIDYKSCNHLYYEIMDADTDDWNYFKEKYQPVYNKMRSEFVALCPKLVDLTKNNK